MASEIMTMKDETLVDTVLETADDVSAKPVFYPVDQLDPLTDNEKSKSIMSKPDSPHRLAVIQNLIVRGIERRLSKSEIFAALNPCLNGEKAAAEQLYRRYTVEDEKMVV